MRINHNICLWLVVCGIFAEKYVELAIILIVNILIAIFFRHITLNRNFIVCYFTILLFSLVAIYFNRYSFAKPIFQCITIFVYCICYYNIFKYLIGVCNINLLFGKYLKVAKSVALLGCLQFLVYFLGGYNIFGFIYNIDSVSEVAPGIIRITSILDEPGYLSLLLTPAFVYYCLQKNSETRWWNRWLIYTVVLLTFSAATYVIILLVLLYKYVFVLKSLFFRWTIIVAIILAFTYFFTEYSVRRKDGKGVLSGVTLKLSETINAFIDMDPYSFEFLNLSSYSTMTNIWVALNAPSRLFGTGIATHEQNYVALYKSDYRYYGLNKEDGYSLLNRIYSEFGVFGILLLVTFLYKKMNVKSIVNLSVFFLLITLCIRGGNYVRYGTVFFFFFYYYSFLAEKEYDKLQG